MTFSSSSNTPKSIHGHHLSSWGVFQWQQQVPLKVHFCKVYLLSNLLSCGDVQQEHQIALKVYKWLMVESDNTLSAHYTDDRCIDDNLKHKHQLQVTLDCNSVLPGGEWSFESHGI